MVHSAPPPPVPRLPNPSDGPLHLLAGVPEGGVPAAPADRLVPLPPHPGPPPPSPHMASGDAWAATAHAT